MPPVNNIYRNAATTLGYFAKCCAKKKVLPKTAPCLNVMVTVRI